jgi:hypothetical protein
MDELQAETNDRVNPQTKSATRRQVGLQIYLPLGLGALAIAALVATMWGLRVAEASDWADALLVVLLVPAMIIGLLVLAALLVLTILVARLMQSIPPPAKRVQDVTAGAAKAVRQTARMVTRPIFALRASMAALEAMVRGLGSILVGKRGNTDGRED